MTLFLMLDKDVRTALLGCRVATVQTCSLRRMSASMGLLKLHWLEQFSKSTISNRVVSIAGNSSEIGRAHV